MKIHMRPCVPHPPSAPHTSSASFTLIVGPSRSTPSYDPTPAIPLKQHTCSESFDQPLGYSWVIVCVFCVVLLALLCKYVQQDGFHCHLQASLFTETVLVNVLSYTLERHEEACGQQHVSTKNMKNEAGRSRRIWSAVRCNAESNV